LHQDMIRRGEEFLSRYEEGDEASALTISLLHALYDGVNQHILVEDKKYGLWLLEHGVK
jgi:hemerythrin